MKVVFTLHDYGAAINIGGGVESKSYSVKIPGDEIPQPVLDYMNKKTTYKSMSVSYEEDEEA